MKAFAALFSDSSTEANYPGYTRVEIDYVDRYFLKLVGVTFPAPTQGSCNGLNHVGVFSENGDLLCITPLSNDLSAKEGEKICVILFCNLPEDINPIARTAYQLVLTGEIKAEDMHPKLYESINNELTKAGIPVIPVTRSAKAELIGKMSDLPSFGNA